MHDDRELIEQRITRELTERVLPLVHPHRRQLTVEAGVSLHDLLPFEVGSQWGAPWGTTWFRCHGEIPDGWSARRLEAIIDLGFDADSPGFQCEGLVRDADGLPVQGIHPRRMAVPVDGSSDCVDIVVEAASNPMFPHFLPSALGSLGTAGDKQLYRFKRADLVVVDPDGEALLHDLDVLDRLMRALAARDPRRVRLLRAIERALDAVAAGASPGHVRNIVAPSLADRAGARTHRIVATGHAHIDTAWLWPIGETVRKCIRSFASAVDLMDRHPEYVFSCSQAQQYDWIRLQEPALFQRIKDKVAGGQWVPVGGMWVEADMNLPSGESLVRQIVHGQRFFREHFGVTCSEMWIPDVFGYPAGLPQVFAAGGMRRFVTQKLSWNRVNQFPHHTFWWEGLDGTRVLTHFPPVDTYNAEITPGEIAGSVERFAEHAWSNWSLVPFGYGDGGGGPTREMLARAERLADLDGMPAIEPGSPSDFFGHVEAEAAAGAAVPVWRGELYFETHRGTLTSQLRTKLGNRRCEKLLREAELWAATAAALGHDVDSRELDDIWHDVLTQQFHDILPGSSIAWVHADAEDVFERVAADLERRISDRLAALAGAGRLIANVATGDRAEVVAVPARLMGAESMGAGSMGAGSMGAGKMGEGLIGDGPTQLLGDGRVACFVRVSGLGLAPLIAAQPDDHVVVTDRSMTNSRLAANWDLDGNLISVIDVVRGRELLPAGQPAAVLELAADHPVNYDAWDLESWTVRSGVAVTAAESVTVEERGPLVGAVAVHRVFGPSAATVRYVLRAGSPRLDMEISLDWNHDEHLLSMVFPLDVHAETATCGVQFGAVRRPTHASTSWDAAKFEVCAHRYVDVAEPDFGVALLNNGRYGHGLFGGPGSRVRVSLARAAKYPDPGADQGHHEVTLALFPHGAGLVDVTAEAERLDLPLRIVGIGASPAPNPPGPVVTVVGRGVEVDAVKAADDGSGDLIVRLHEATGNRVAITVGAMGRVVAAAACDLMEASQRHFEVSDGILAATLRPFELVTLRLTLAAAS